QRAVRHRMVEKPGDEHGVEVVRAVDDHTEHLDRWDLQVTQLPQQSVLLAGQPLVELLERVHLSGLGDEADDMPGDAALAQFDQTVVLPLLDRLAPWERQQAGRALRRGSEDEPHARHDRMALHSYAVPRCRPAYTRSRSWLATSAVSVRVRSRTTRR